ncbi:MAG: hypothetical protein HY905_26320 [Deltaproteobacteria bacterium]|nr:hypothetical protein [Deltaproteobacteria bacterium]
MLLAAAGCGAKTDLDRMDAAPPDVPLPTDELCNGLNDDFDLDDEVDEDFRDELGRYIDDHHCGVCGHDCDVAVEHATETACLLVDEAPTCGARACEAGWTPSDTGRCVPWDAHLCLPCLDDGDCGGFPEAVCARLGGEARCSVTCEGPDSGCPDGYVCDEGLCEPPGNSCSCDPGEFFTVSCNLELPDGTDCLGTAVCEDGVLSDCAGAEEICDGRDNDCDGDIDEGYRDEREQYTLDVHNCGACGVDCTETELPDGDLVCGGDPYGPRCVLLCAEATDGIDVGDHLDADLIIGNGCECLVGNLVDEAGPVHAVGEDLDVDCDGADGDVPNSLYVAPDGDDANPGSPMYPLATISEGVRRAAESLGTELPTPDVFVAAGTYVELVRVRDGVRLHGGYRNDFLGLEPDSFVTQVVAPDASDGPGGAALVLEDGAGATTTVVEGIHFRGTDAPAPGLPAFGAFFRGTGPRLALRNLEIRSGQGGAGNHGAFGSAGAAPPIVATAGEPPRAAVEDSFHGCLPEVSNVVAGGPGGSNTCEGAEVSGGTGGAASCPSFSAVQPSGSPGRAGPGGALGGMAGAGGWDCEGPTEGFPCPVDVCCGLADFTVPLEYELAGDGGNGSNGGNGTAGTGCSDAMGDLAGETWTPAIATTGTTGRPGGGGGGGGAGGGAQMTYYSTVCPYPDGLGGGGGGGGAGGCGGLGGSPGTAGAPSIGIVFVAGATPAAPTFENVRILTGDGGIGGRGGGGGDGGLGALGGAGGEVPREERTTPPLAGPSSGGHGGKGGNGGPGGGGGGGCGGPAVGVWALLGGAPDPGVAAAVAAGATVVPGHGGRGGRGGPGAAPGGDGADGVVMDVVVE